ncbi:STM3941 family protein [Hymenobacter swuensis]|uniref:Uncharacterized protein n=1 Tax=Hymenobacter swuensis DY53 TaxID=1227739 RepID=W8EWG8_9BACT|nr:STM3941 family protein [Hymenobacter swuensis]AHJ96127.1 hypothetical protein Hsw_0532 [Hymenobacter swuensis DY53]
MEIKLYKSPWRAVKLLLGSSAFVALGTFLLRQPGTPSWVAWACIGFFGLGIPGGLFQLLDRRPQIIINEVGIFDRTTYHSFINWDIIQNAYLVSIHGQKILCLVVPAEFEPSRTKGTVGQALAQLSRELGFQELNISLGMIQIDEVRFAHFLLAMTQVERPADRTQLLTQYAQ